MQRNKVRVILASSSVLYNNISYISEIQKNYIKSTVYRDQYAVIYRLMRNYYKVYRHNPPSNKSIFNKSKVPYIDTNL